jgi:hypothetical protein
VLNFLVDRSFCTVPRDYFDDLVSQFPREWAPFPHPDEAITVIREAGGVPIPAHPDASLSHVGVTEETLRPFLDFSIAGLECYACYHDEATTCSSPVAPTVTVGSSDASWASRSWTLLTCG